MASYHSAPANTASRWPATEKGPALFCAFLILLGWIALTASAPRFAEVISSVASENVFAMKCLVRPVACIH
jgi:hypothetical protein